MYTIIEQWLLIIILWQAKNHNLEAVLGKLQMICRDPWQFVDESPDNLSKILCQHA